MQRNIHPVYTKVVPQMGKYSIHGAFGQYYYVRCKYTLYSFYYVICACWYTLLIADGRIAHLWANVIYLQRSYMVTWRNGFDNISIIDIPLLLQHKSCTTDNHIHLTLLYMACLFLHLLNHDMIEHVHSTDQSCIIPSLNSPWKSMGFRGDAISLKRNSGRLRFRGISLAGFVSGRCSCIGNPSMEVSQKKLRRWSLPNLRSFRRSTRTKCQHPGASRMTNGWRMGRWSDRSRWLFAKLLLLNIVEDVWSKMTAHILDGSITRLISNL